MSLVSLFIFCHVVASVVAVVPRRVIISGTNFIESNTGETIMLTGPNIVVKGPPYLPYVSGDTYCVDNTNGACVDTGTCTSCSTFNEADVSHIKAMGWNSIRLGVVWAGAQPSDENALDAGFLKMLHAILDLTDRTGLHVVLDNHGDMVASVGCGNGVPMWFSRKYASDLIGKPLVTGLPYSIIPSLNVENVDGYDFCGGDEAKWANHAGDPNYNLLNECCQAMNSPNPGGLGYTTINQRLMDAIVMEGPGRDDFIRFWSLMAVEAAGHPSAFACELMNEPMSVRRGPMFDTWKLATEAITAIVPDMSVSLCDTGEGPVLPAWLGDIDASIAISQETTMWIKESNNSFYAWHWYGAPSSADDAVANVQAISDSWQVPTYLTEFMSCDAWQAASAANISYSYWHYSAYCDTGPYFGSPAVPDDSFGACILGWNGGDSSKTCP